MHILFHVVAAILVGLYFHLSGIALIAFVLGSTLIDLDHVIYLFFHKIKDPKKMKQWMQKEAKKHNPHFYFMHTFEYSLFLLMVGLWNPIILVFAMGHILHMFIDIATYVIIYRSYKPWLKFMFGTYYFLMV